MRFTHGRMNRFTFFSQISMLILLAMSGRDLAAQSSIDSVLLDHLRVTEDSDGFTNLRSAPASDGKIVGKVLSGGVVALTEVNGAKWPALWTEDPGQGSAHIHSSRLRRVDSWKQKEFGDWPQTGSASLEWHGLKVTAGEAPFDRSKHRISRTKEDLVLVDGRFPWGQDGGMPQREVRLEIALHGKKIDLPKEALENLYEPNVGSLALLTPGTADKQAFIVMSNSDGAGGYVVVWAIKDGKYLNRVVFNPY